MSASLNKVLSVSLAFLAGFVVCTCLNRYLLKVEEKVSVLQAAQTPQQDKNDIRSLFGVNLLIDLPDIPCAEQDLKLTGYIKRDSDVLYVIEGSTGERVYRQSALVEQRYPIVSDSPSQILLRKHGGYIRLCIDKPAGGKKGDAKPTANFIPKIITTPYLSLAPVPDKNNNFINYTITKCDYRCKMMLPVIGLKETDILVAINDASLDGKFNIDKLRELATARGRIDITVIRDNNIMAIAITDKKILSQLTSTK